MRLSEVSEVRVQRERRRRRRDQEKGQEEGRKYHINADQGGDTQAKARPSAVGRPGCREKHTHAGAQAVQGGEKGGLSPPKVGSRVDVCGHRRGRICQERI